MTELYFKVVCLKLSFKVTFENSCYKMHFKRYLLKLSLCLPLGTLDLYSFSIGCLYCLPFLPLQALDLYSPCIRSLYSRPSPLVCIASLSALFTVAVPPAQDPCFLYSYSRSMFFSQLRVFRSSVFMFKIVCVGIMYILIPGQMEVAKPPSSKIVCAVAVTHAQVKTIFRWLFHNCWTTWFVFLCAHTFCYFSLYSSSFIRIACVFLILASWCMP